MNGSEDPSRPSARVLLAEDDSALADRLAEHLRAHGFTVSVTADGTDALARVTADLFDVLVITMLLPGASGFQVVQHLRAAKGEAVPVVMTSELDAIEHREYAHLVGVNWFLAKPFTPDDLHAVILNLLPN